MNDFIKINNDLLLIESKKMNNNSYLLIDKKCMLIIDPSFCGKKIAKIIDKFNYEVKGILLTHAHFDHTYDVKQLIDKYHCNAYIFYKDKITYEKYDCTNLVNVNLNRFNNNIIYFKTEKLNINNFEIGIMHTPGHTQGSVIYIWKQYVFTGDTLFYDGYGRFDFGGGSPSDLVKSLNKINKNIPNNFTILPGHGPYGRFDKIKQCNFSFKQIIEDRN